MSNHALRGSGFLGPEFNEFLFEPIGVDQFGRPLSVVSALARLDLDAWAEASKLALMPKDIAAEKLSAFIRRCTEFPQAVRDSHKIAERLVVLLPTRATLARQQAEAPIAPGQATQSGRSAMVFLLVMVVLVGAQLLTPRMHPPASPSAAPAAAGTAEPLILSTAAPK